MSNVEVYDMLETLRDGYLENSVIPETSEVLFAGKSYEQFVWCEDYLDVELIVFQLKTDNILGSSVYCLGLERAKTGEIKKLSNEQLWDIGIP